MNKRDTPTKRAAEARKRAEEAKTKAVLAAKRLANDQFYAGIVLKQAELKILRDHVIGAMGEEAYWNAVREEIES